MKKIIYVLLLVLTGQVALMSQVNHKGTVEISDANGSTLQLTDTTANKTWQLVSGLYSGFQIGYLTGNLTDANAPFFIHENGGVGIGTTALHSNAKLTLGGDLSFLSGYGLRLDNERFISASNENLFVGLRAGNTTMTGDENSFFGTDVGLANSTGKSNSFFGAYSGYQNTTGVKNTFLGSKSGSTNILGEDNVYVGFKSGFLSQGSFNTFLGTRAGLDASGTKNVFLGYTAGLGDINASNSLYIGNDAYDQVGGSLIYGRFDQGKVGINTTTLEANSALTVNGKVAAEEYLLADGTPLLSSITSPWALNASNLIFDTGNVGIGTATLDTNSELTVDGGITSNGDIRLGAGFGIRSNNQRFISESNTNMFFGPNAGNPSVTGERNMFFGTYAGRVNSTGGYNTVLGYVAAYSNTTGAHNMFLGNSAGYNNTTGSKNLFLGSSSGQSNQIGAYNTYVGVQSGWKGEGSKNTFLGIESGMYNEQGNENTIMGYGAGRELNNAIGQNTFIGTDAGRLGVNSSKSIAIGYKSGYDTEGEKNVFIGYKAGMGSDITASNKLYIGNDNVTTTSGKLIYGEFDNGKVGINTTTLEASSALTVNGKVAAEEYLLADGTPLLSSITSSPWASNASNLIFDTGKVGIGTATLDSNSELTVDGGIASNGNIDLGIGFGITSGGLPFISREGNENTFVGVNSGSAVTSGVRNTFLGSESGLSNSSGQRNTFIGTESGKANSTGSQNMFLGAASGYKNTTGSNNMFIGYNAGYDNESGVQNTYVGTSAGKGGVTSGMNTSIGYLAGTLNNSSDGRNTNIGMQSGEKNVSGGDNVTVGYRAGQDFEGSNNVFLGRSAGGASSASGDGNVFIGRYAGIEETNASNKLYIANTSNSSKEALIYGQFDQGKLGINTTTLEVNSALTVGGKVAAEEYLLADGTSLLSSIASSPWAVNVDDISFGTGKVGIGTATLDATSALTVGGKITASDFQLADGTSLTPGLWSSGTSGISFASGTVGIGTVIDPDVDFHVQGVGTGAGTLVSSIMIGKINGPQIQAIQETADDDVQGLAFRVKSSAAYADDSFEAMRLSKAGNLGIGTDTPQEKLEVNGKIKATEYLLSDGSSIGVSPWTLNTTDISFDTGNVGIGVAAPSQKLEVDGNGIFFGELEAEKVIVSLTPGDNWPDYVFEPEFRLRPLSEVEAFVKDNKHLPEVPSAKEVEANGINLGSMDATLLKKVEELTLYMIEMNKKIEKLEEENKKLKELVKKEK